MTEELLVEVETEVSDDELAKEQPPADPEVEGTAGYPE